eukprot:3646832-Prymnesium_polylepis.1
MALGELEARRALQVDVTLVEGQQPLAHEYHRAVLEGRDARPLERRLLEEGVAHLIGRRHVDLNTQAVGPHAKLLLELPRFHPLVGHNLANHRLREDPVHLRVWQQQGDLLVAHDRAGQLFDAVDLLKVDGHRKDEDAP